MEKYYKILEIHTNATEQEVTQAYRDMVKVWHPDRFPNDIRLQKRADRKLKEINDAYQRIVEHLKNPHKQQQSQQYERTEKQEEQAGQPPPRQTKPNKSRRFYMKYYGLFLVIGSISLAEFMGHFMLGLIRNTGIFTNNQTNSGEQFGLSVIRQNRTDKPIRKATVDLHVYAGAIKDCNKAIELNPEYAAAYNNRGFAKAELHDYTGAIQDLSKAEKLGYTKAYEEIQRIQKGN